MTGRDEGASLDAALLTRSAAYSLVNVARERRLVMDSTAGSLRVDLNWVDEVALTLVDQAIGRGSDLSLLFPTQAGNVGVLIAAQFLLGKLVAGERRASVGLVTSDPVGAARVWSRLSLAAPGARHTRLAEVYPAYVADREGRSPLGRRPFNGVLVGDRSDRWNVDYVVVDRLAGRADADLAAPTLRLYSDPLDPGLTRDDAAGTPVWAWSRETLAAWNDELEQDTPGTVPFSASHGRLATMATDCTVTIHVVEDEVIEQILRRLRDDLIYVSGYLGSAATRAQRRGTQIAWYHVNTLGSLPCRPSAFDRFSGWPPFAARATRTFSQEIAAWSMSLEGDLTEIGQVIASDIEDLRWAMEERNPFAAAIEAMATDRTDGLAIFKTRTAARAFFAELGEDPDSTQVGNATVGLLRSLHLQPSHPWALSVGLPAPWEWVRLGGGLTPDLHLMVIGGHDARIAERRLTSIDEARSTWAERRSEAWRILLLEEPPASPELERSSRRVSVLGVAPIPTPADPLDSIESLMRSEPIQIGSEGAEEFVATPIGSGRWASEVEATRVATDAGTVYLASAGSVEVLDANRVLVIAVDELSPGQRLIIGRSEGRLGLLEALEDQLRAHRPDLLAARLLSDSLHFDVVHAFEASGLTRAELHDNLSAAGCERLEPTTASWVNPAGPMAPRDEADLERLAAVIGLGYSGARLRESFAAVKRIRQFRREAGRVLSEMATSSMASPMSSTVDARTGLSASDLRNAVVAATVLRVSPADERVPITRLGRLEELE